MGFHDRNDLVVECRECFLEVRVSTRSAGRRKASEHYKKTGGHLCNMWRDDIEPREAPGRDDVDRTQEVAAELSDPFRREYSRSEQLASAKALIGEEIKRALREDPVKAQMLEALQIILGCTLERALACAPCLAKVRAAIRAAKEEGADRVDS